MNVAAFMAIVIILTIFLLTFFYVVIGELFNKLVKKRDPKWPLSLGSRLFLLFSESYKLAKKIKNSSETLDPEMIKKMNRTPVSVAVAAVLAIVWCVTGIIAYAAKLSIVIAVIIACAELAAAVIIGRKLSEKYKGDETVARKCMKCKISRLTVYNTQRLREETFAEVRLTNGSRYKLIHVTNYSMTGQRERAIDIDLPCYVYYDFLPFAKCVIDPGYLPKLKY